MTKYKLVAIRFFSLFFSGGASAAVILFSNPVQFSNLTDLKKFGTSVLVAFIFGGVGALEKSLVSTDTTVTTPTGTQTINAPVDNEAPPVV